jgi:hypothetical protein
MSNILFSTLNIILFLVGIKIMSALTGIIVPEFMLGWMSSVIFIHTMDVCEKKKTTRVADDDDTIK